jgi:2-polyprenyl-3-methyl-5-hydroxy-6-metoxy-1,4-benzoquinol methylase
MLETSGPSDISLSQSLSQTSAIEKRPEVFLSRTCPCCRKVTLNQGYQVQSEAPAEERTFDEIKQTWQHFFKLTSYFTYRRCASCGQLYCPTFFDQNQLETLYSRMSDNTANLPIEIAAKTQRRYFDFLRQFHATKGTYLEFGPDIGLLTEVCSKDGSFENMILIEPNLEVHAALSARIGKLPHNIHADMRAYEKLADQSVDTIAMIHVLDHVLEPAELLAVLKRKLKPGGKLLLVTHDERSLIARLFGTRWPAYCLQHPQLYNPLSIRKALEASGYRVDGVKKTYNYFPVTYLLRHALWALRLPIKLPNWYWLTVPLKLGNIATVATA